MVEGGGGQAQAPEVRGQLPPLEHLLGGHLRPLALALSLRDPTDTLGCGPVGFGRPTATGKRNAQREEQQTPDFHEPSG
jgi:hypothetical protein